MQFDLPTFTLVSASYTPIKIAVTPFKPKFDSPNVDPDPI